MKQLLIIHGGHTFSDYSTYRKYLSEKTLDYYKLTHPIRWKERLTEELPGFDVLLPSMPNSDNAVYDEWAIQFEKLLALLNDDAQILGHSLGAMFVAKYLNINRLSKPVQRLILVSAAYNDVAGEEIGEFGVGSAVDLPQSAKEIHLFHSEDDPVVPFSELAKFQNDLPYAIAHVFSDRGHFIDETFPEIAQLIKQK
ncbi:hypothetical protein EOL96_08590 [Candidatus Saccharibacteria bacterium]|nr:hypothetical protein [Candidatus Saccharibacteria bacterium]